MGVHSRGRYSSRSLVIPFTLPTIGPTNKDEAKNFCDLNEAMKHVSSAVGWVISLGKQLQEKQQFEDGLLNEVSSRLSGVEPRLCMAYTTLVYCATKVITIVDGPCCCIIIHV